VRLLLGSHGAHPGVRTVRARRLAFRFEKPPAYETDGEWNQAESAELTIEAVPQALEVLVP
jgi:diacylglycerol kinase family enzyme